MSKEKFEGVEPEIKKEIMEEGFGEEGAAVLIGKKEEMPELLEKLEKEGRAENLGSYIKMHKEIALPKEEISSELKEKIKSGLVFYWGDILRYVDKDGNIANVKINSDKISSLHHAGRGIREQVEDELEKLGFFRPGKTEGISLMEGDQISRKIDKEIQNYKAKIEEQIRQKKKEEFDF